ncbi:MAG: GspE/PulE family protein [Marinobacterium sp.]
MVKIRLGEMLVASKKISARDLERALVAQQEMGGLLGQVLVKLGLVSESDVAVALCTQLDVHRVYAAEYPEEPVVVAGVSSVFLQSHQMVVLSNQSGELQVACPEPQSQYLSHALALASGAKVVLKLGLETDIIAVMQRYAEQQSVEGEADEAFDSFGGDEEFIEHLRDLASEAPVIRQVNQIIHRALDMGASDIHIEPFDDGLHLRYRVDGVIQEMPDPPSLEQAAAIASRIKLLAHLNIAERRLPQDGRIMTRVKGHELDLRVSTIPTVHGESIVMRVLDRQSIKLSLESMGFSDDVLSAYKELLHRPHGVLLLTGPTGSGKTTTLYASLATLDSQALKIITVEDPVEYQLNGINQIQVQPQIELDFARALRSILRQDPDIIMIGEMRDSETAQIAVQSALTGHLVLSTLHTNTASGAIARLEDMGVERYLITSSVNGVLAQRLVRRLCSHCKVETELEPAVAKSSGLNRWMPEHQHHIYTSHGCEHCQGTGYSGRVAIHELIVLNEELQKAVIAGSDAASLHTLARQNGMLTLYEDGLRKVVTGVTSLEEVLRVTQDQNSEQQF